MFIKNWKKEIFSIPNLLSLFRLLIIPVYIVLYLNATEPYQYFTAGGIMVVSCLTDMIDGKIARRYNMITTLGKILDPLADKITQFSLTLCLSLKYPVLQPVLALFLVKEIFQAVIGLVNLIRGKMLPGALMAGKICTTVLFISLITLVLFPDMNPFFVDMTVSKVTTTEEKTQRSWMESWLKVFEKETDEHNDDFGGEEKEKKNVILDEEVPLADAPQTGDISGLWAAISLISLSGAALLSKKREEA